MGVHRCPRPAAAAVNEGKKKGIAQPYLRFRLNRIAATAGCPSLV